MSHLAQPELPKPIVPASGPDAGKLCILENGVSQGEKESDLMEGLHGFRHDHMFFFNWYGLVRDTTRWATASCNWGYISNKWVTVVIYNPTYMSYNSICN